MLSAFLLLALAAQSAAVPLKCSASDGRKLELSLDSKAKRVAFGVVTYTITRDNARYLTATLNPFDGSKSYAGGLLVLNRKTGQMRRSLIVFEDIEKSEEMKTLTYEGFCQLPLPAPAAK